MEKCLLAEIDVLDDGQGCFASNDHLAKVFKTSTASIANQISNLRSRGYVETLSFDGRRRRLRVKADLTYGLRQDSPPDEGSVHSGVISSKEVPNENKVEEEKELLVLWNALPDPISSIRTMSPGRRTAFKARLRDPFWREHWKQAITMLPGIPFMLGKNERNWTVDIDFFLKPDSVVKIIEGKYNRNGSKHDSRGLKENFDYLPIFDPSKE